MEDILFIGVRLLVSDVNLMINFYVPHMQKGTTTIKPVKAFDFCIYFDYDHVHYNETAYT